MAPLKLLLSQQPLRHYFTRTTSSSPSLSHFSRTLCSSSSSSSSSSSQPPEPPHPTPTPTPPPRRQQQQPISIQTVSYPVKPKDPSDPLPEEQQQQAQAPPQRRAQAGPVNPEARTWTREDIRYVKDIPNISPVAYPARVAPLPGDKPREGEEEGDKDGEVNVGGENKELELERRRIEAENREMMRRVLRVEEEKLPFPTLIKVDNSEKKKVFYDLKEAIQLVKANAKRKFDETLEAHVKLNPELRRTDLKLSGSVQLPHGGTTKSVRVAVFAEGAAADEAREAGADLVGGLELIEGIKNGTVKVDYDMCFATKNMMVHMNQIAKFLRRLMPSTKNGGVTKEVGRAVREIKGSAVLFKKDKTAIVHVGLGQVSYSEDALRENVAAFVNALLLAKPAGLKKSSKYAGYVESFHICSTMGPSFPVTIQSLSVAADRYNRLQRV